MGKKIEVKNGDKYGRLTIIKEVKPRIFKSGNVCRRVLCKCKCGNRKEVNLYSIKSGLTKSCGCLLKEKSTETMKKIRHLGMEVKNGHGMSETNTYFSWKSMKSRCLYKKNVAFNRYGGRGIKICDRWLIFENFHADMGDRPEGKSLDRIDNEGNYEPGNCRWATRKEQGSNKRNNKFLEYNGKKQTIAEWTRELGFKRQRAWRGDGPARRTRLSHPVHLYRSGTSRHPVDLPQRDERTGRRHLLAL